MSRTLSAGQQAEIIKPVTAPLYLVELQFNTPKYYSSRQELTIGAVTYEANKLISTKLSVSAKGIVTGTISISNIDLAMGATALAETLQGKTCKVSTSHTTDSSLLLANTEVLLEGEVIGVSSISEKEVILNISSVNANIMYTPRIYCAPNLFNHAIPVGTLITWGDSTYELIGE